MDKIIRKNTRYIIIHCSDTEPSKNLNTEELNKIHRQKGFLNIKYHFIIKRDGTVETGRHVDEVGSHTEEFDEESISICLIGGIAPDQEVEPRLNYTSRQWDSLKTTIKSLRLLYPGAHVLGFNDVEENKISPYFDVQAWFDF